MNTSPIINKFIFLNLCDGRSYLQKEKGIYDQLLQSIKVFTPPHTQKMLMSWKVTMLQQIMQKKENLFPWGKIILTWEIDIAVDKHSIP